MSVLDIRENTPVSGIDEEKMKALILDVYNYSEKIKAKLDHIEELVSNLNGSCKGSSFESFISKFGKCQNNFAIINANIHSYASDLTKAKNNFHRIFNDVSELSKSKNN